MFHNQLDRRWKFMHAYRELSKEFSALTSGRTYRWLYISRHWDGCWPWVSTSDSSVSCSSPKTRNRGSRRVSSCFRGRVFWNELKDDIRPTNERTRVDLIILAWMDFTFVIKVKIHRHYRWGIAEMTSSLVLSGGNIIDGLIRFGERRT